jgi:hypothetical protein
LVAEIQVSAIAAAPRAERPTMLDVRPPESICLLLPIWGEDFIDQFVEHSLPTLLARGNIPALTAALPTRFVFLTRARDEKTIRAHPGCRRLQRVCTVEFLPIDDLITSGNHSTTITLAYARAVRQAGAAMVDTCFFFLVSDCIMADGSLSAVLARIQSGASAVQVGNFQVDEDTANEWLYERIAGAGSSLELSPREMMRWALGCLHPITAANIVNFPLCYNTNVNRLLWRVDENTLIGRFYLLHMICIRPETADFVVGSSCDYSFVPEMCPSGKVETIADSDEYLVVEIQPHGHETGFLRLGSTSVDAIAESLSEWTTARHRANAHQTIVFHADALPASLDDSLVEAEALISDIRGRLAPKPQPYRDHPYWLGAIAAFDAAVAERDDRRGRTGFPVVRAMRWIRGSLFGQVPQVTRAHPRWRDLSSVLAACRACTAETSSILIVANRSTPLTEWLRRRAPSAVLISLRRLLRRRSVEGMLPGTFDAAFIEMVDNKFDDLDEVMHLVPPLLRPGGQIILAGLNTDWSAAHPESLSQGLATRLAPLISSGFMPHEFHVITASRWRWRLNGACIAASVALFRRPTLLMPLSLMSAAVVAPFAALANLLSTLGPNRASRRRVVSSVFIRFLIGSSAT